MKYHFDFKFGHPSHPLDDYGDIRYRENSVPLTRRQGKPVKVFYTHGLQVVGVPQELVQILGARAIRQANGTRFVTSSHFETADAFYLLRIETLAHMALPQ